jgi:hypothetical protein
MENNIKKEEKRYFKGSFSSSVFNISLIKELKYNRALNLKSPPMDLFFGSNSKVYIPSDTRYGSKDTLSHKV